MSSESQVKNIMECIDEGLKELDDLEEKLERYDCLLQVRQFFGNQIFSTSTFYLYGKYITRSIRTTTRTSHILLAVMKIQAYGSKALR
jgi:hypothetical protein